LCIIFSSAGAVFLQLVLDLAFLPAMTSMFLLRNFSANSSVETLNNLIDANRIMYQITYIFL